MIATLEGFIVALGVVCSWRRSYPKVFLVVLLMSAVALCFGVDERASFYTAREMFAVAVVSATHELQG